MIPVSDMLQALLTLRFNGPTDTSVGICGNMEFILNRRISHYSWRRAYETWPKWSKDNVFPVPAPRGLIPTKGSAASFVFFSGMDMWRGEYGMDRVELLDHYIKMFRQFDQVERPQYHGS